MNELLPDEDSIFPGADIVYSTFWNRLWASLVDGLIIIMISMPVTYYNITVWKIPSLYILISLLTVIYKPFLEYRYGATWGKMVAGLQVVGQDFGKITLKEEMRRISFYLVPSILQHIMILGVYYSVAFYSINNYREFNRYMITSNPAISWLNVIVVILLFADCITFLTTKPGRFLHDRYAGTNVIDRSKTNTH
jgi:uncharacterized RDD family membrane protein YckC